MSPLPSLATGAIYCRIPHLRSADQTPVDRQELLCRQLAAERGIRVDPRSVYLDTRAMAWQRERPRSDWEAMLAAARSGAVRHLLCYDAEQLLWQPFNLAELLRTAQECGITLHSPATDRDLRDPKQRNLLLAEAERACRAAEHVSATARAADEIAAAQGRPHGGGRRAYGYEAGTYRLVEAEAAVVRAVYLRFLAGESIRAIAVDLYARGVPTAGGNRWTVGGVTRILDAPRYAGLRVFRGAVLRDADGGYVPAAWEPCVSLAEWEQVRALREGGRRARSLTQRPPRPYPLTGLLLCTRCDRHMVGHMIGAYPFYSCSSKSSLEAERCRRHIAAGTLEAFVEEIAVSALESWRAADAASPVATPVDRRFAELDADLRHLREAGELRRSGQLSVGEYATLRSAALRRVREAQHTVGIRPTEALDGVTTGHAARRDWGKLPLHRRAAVLRLLFSSIRIGPSTTSRSVFDYDRVELIPNPSAGRTN